MSKLFRLGYIGLLSILISSPIYADKGGVSHGSHEGAMKGEVGYSKKEYKRNFDLRQRSNRFYNRGLKKGFSTNDRTTINNFFSEHPFNTTGLPPGIAKNLARGKPLPPGISKVFLPSDLTDLLGTYPDYEYLVVGRDVVLVNREDQIIVDILRNVLR